MPEPTLLDPRAHALPGRSDPHAPRTPLRGGARRRGARLAGLVLAITAVAASLAPGAARAQEVVTPERLAERIPDAWHGLAVAETDAGFDQSSAAFAAGHYDHEDERASRDLSVGITDLGPHRDAAMLTYEADEAAGRVERLEVGGHPAFAAEGSTGPELDVIAGRMWIRASAFGELYDADDLREAVASLPLDGIAELSELEVAPGAVYRPQDFARGALRSFLPGELLGLPRDDGFYAEVHPTGVAYGGLPYLGERDGAEVRLEVTVWDLGTLADAARERLASERDAWTPFEHDGRHGFVEAGVPEPRVLLFADRFRLQVEASGSPGVDPDWLREAFAEIDLERLERLAEALPAPEPALDPLSPQPALADPERLAEVLPDELAGRARGEVQADVQDGFGSPYATALARATYPGEGEDALEWILEVHDQGLIAYGSQWELDAMEPVEAGGRTVHAHPGRPMVATTVSDRFVVVLLAYGEAPPEVTERMVEAASELDLSLLRALAEGDGS